MRDQLFPSGAQTGSFSSLTSQHLERGSHQTAVVRERSRSEAELLLSAHCLCTIVKSRHCKSNHYVLWNHFYLLYLFRGRGDVVQNLNSYTRSGVDSKQCNISKVGIVSWLDQESSPPLSSCHCTASMVTNPFS